MALMLEVVSSHAQSMGPNARKVLGDKELKIGREDDNDWVFHQSYVSRHQAVIRCVNGMYFLEQTGNCPLALNDPARVVERNRIVRLSSGDRILIDDIEIRLQETDSPPVLPTPAATPGSSPMDLLRAAPDPVPFPDMGTPVGSGGVGRRDDPLVILGISPATSAPPPAPSTNFPKPNSPLEFALPEVRPAATPATSSPGLPDNWWSKPSSAAASPQSSPRPDFPDISPPPVVPPRPAPLPSAAAPPGAAPVPGAASPPSLPSLCLQELLKGAGLEANTQLPPQVAAQLGEALRIVVEGTRQVLLARNDIRREFRLPTTQVERKDNNPLKFSADAADALHKLLVQRSPAYLDTVRAFSDAFDDIRVHQAAMLAALRKAFEHMFEQFDPDSLAARLAQRGARGSVLGLGKPNLWEQYAARYHEWAADPDFAFRQLFGEEFGKAYEQSLAEQKQRLRADRNG
jgi:type VI secretion system protein ImpI